MDPYELSGKDRKVQSAKDCANYPEIIRDALPSTKLLYEEAATGLTETRPGGSNEAMATLTLPTIVVDDADEHDDDPPPYTAVVPPNHVGWPFDFPSGIPYSMHTSTTYRADAPLATFQAGLTSPPSYYPEGSDGQHGTSITLPLMPYPIFKYDSHRSLFVQRSVPFSDDHSMTKSVGDRSRRYNVVLVAAVVIVFLMALSLMVRLIVDKSLWRG